MNNKVRYIPLVIIGAILLSLLAIVPAFGAGEVSFIDPGDINDRNDGTLDDTTPEDQEWSRQGGMVGLMVEDSDLDVPVQRILLPSDRTMLAGSNNAAVEAHSTMVSGYTVSTTTTPALEDDDYVLIGDGTVRQVEVDEDDGSVTLNAPYAMSQSGPIYKVNIGSGIFDDCMNCAMAEKIGSGDLSDFGGLAEFATHNEIVNSNIGESPSTGSQLDAANRLDGANLGSVPDREDIVVVHVPSTGPAALVGVRRVSGKTVSLRVPTSDLSGGDVYAAYWSEEQNETGSNVKVRSQAHQEQTTVVLTETGPSSGEFVLKIMLSKPPTIGDAMFTVGRNDLGSLPVNPRDVVTLSHPDSTDTTPVETTSPVFSSFAPAHNTSRRDDRPEVSAQITDGDSGLDKDGKKITVIFRITEDGSSKTIMKDPQADGDVNGVSGGFEVRQRIPGAEAPDDDATIEWWVKAEDNAGNVGYSDQQASKDGQDDTCEADESTTATPDALIGAKCQPFKILIDSTKPTLVRAQTGRHWDTSLDTGDSDDKTEYRVSKAEATSILVVFNEHLDDATVAASDFEVDGNAPIDAEVHNVKVRDDEFAMKADPDDSTKMIEDEKTGDGNSDIKGADVQDEGEDKGYVFLTVEEMAPTAKPKVELTGDVSDVAGNRQNAGKVNEADDRVAPTLTVTLTEGDRPVTKDKVNLTITSNENIGSPSVSYHMVKSSDDDAMVDATARAASSVVFKSATEYTATISPSANGLYTVYVTALDSSGGNTGTKGDNSGSIDVVGDTSAILFERDKNISAPDVDPDKDGVQDEFSIDDPNAFLRIDFSGEGNEYDATTKNGDRIGDDLDTHGMVTIVSAMLGDMDIKDRLQGNEGSNVFLFHASGLDLGEHELSVTAMDEAGNKNASAFKATITITERKPYTLKLNPGWNLASIPGEPMDSDINAVMADHPATQVLTYDPSVPGSWLTALRGADGSFSGTLTDITATRAYWIETPTFQALKVDIPKQAVGVAVLPSINLVQGWNLVPILDVDGDFKLDDSAGYNYFSGGSLQGSQTVGIISSIYTFNTITNSWVSVSSSDVEVGKGYWVYSLRVGVLTP